MNNPLKILSVSILLVAALYAGVKGYLYFNIKSELDDAIAMAGPFVQIEYGGISSGLDGRISIEDIDIFPPGVEDRLHVDSVSVQWPHIGYLFSGLQGTPGQALPEYMSLALNGMRLPTKGGLADSLRAQQKLRLAALSGGGKVPDPCSLYGTFGGEDYAAIGYDELVLDAGFGYELDAASQELGVHIDFRMRDMQTISMDLKLTGASQPAAMMMGVIPRLKAYTASFRADPELTARAVSYCADRRDQSKAEYIRTVASETGAGFVPGAGMRRAIGRYLQNPGEVLISMHPAQPLDMTTLVHYRPEDMVALLGLRVQVGGEDLEDLSFDISVPQGLGGAAPGFGSMPGHAGLNGTQPFSASATPRVPESARQSSHTLTGASRQKPAASRPQARYLATQAKDLKRYVGRDVRLFTHTRQSPRSGVLVSVKHGQAHVEQRVHSGTMTIFVPMTEIKTAEVFRRPGRD